jgi:hypothetical protein
MCSICYLFCVISLFIRQLGNFSFPFFFSKNKINDFTEEGKTCLGMLEG